MSTGTEEGIAGLACRRMTDQTLEQWWDDLTPAQRGEARSLDEGASMPFWMVASLAWVGYPQVAAGRRDPQEKATFRFPEDVARFVSGRSGPET